MTDNENKKKYKFNFGLGEAGNEERTRKPGIQMICGFTVMMIVMVALLISVMLLRLNTAMRQNTTRSVEMLDDQMAIAFDELIDSVQNDVGIIFTNESYYTYDPTLTLGSVDAVTETKISDDLTRYASQRDYLDFCIVYPYGHVVGQLSDTTWGEYGSEIYDKLSEKMGSENETWISEKKVDGSVMYYLHRLNENAIAVASLKESDVDDIFTDNGNIKGLNIYVIDNSLTVLDSPTDKTSIGKYVETGIYKLVDRDGGTQINRLYLVSTAKLSNGWLLVISVPYTSTNTGIETARLFGVILAVVVLILAVSFTIFMTRKIILTVNATVGKLDVKSQTDLLTGLINKKSFEEIVNLTLSENYDQSGYAMIFMDIDNFKGVNDRCGHDVGDNVLRSFSHTIGSVFRTDDIKGRLGGDEFCVLMKMPHGISEEEMITKVNEVCDRFRETLHKKGATGRQDMPAVTSSMGAAISLSSDDTFEDLYHRADTALYHSKHKGKDTWSIYGEE